MSETRAGQSVDFTHKQILTIVIALMMGMFLAALDQTVVSTAIRTIADDLSGFSLQAWATTAFLITSTISTPLYGKLSDMYGRRPFFIIAIGLFIAGSMLCGLAQSMYQLAAYRAFQGLGAGGLMSLALAIIGDIVPPRERSRYQGYFLAVFGTSSVLGPLIGGVLSGADSLFGIAGWRWIFYINVPIGAAALLVVYRVLHIPHTPRRHRIDWPGALALVMCLVPVLTVAEQGREWGWTSTGALVCYAIGLVGLIGFLLAEKAAGDEALLPLRMFQGKTFAVAGASSAIVGMGMFGGIALIPQYLQVVHDSSPTIAGLQMIPLVAGIMTGAMSSGQFIARKGRYKIFPVAGTALMTVALALMSRVGTDTPIPLLMVVMAFFGLGLGFNMQTMIVAVQNAARPQDMGIASSSVVFFRQMGGTLGTAVFLSVLFSTLKGSITDAIAAARAKPAFLDALARHPDQAAMLQSGGDATLRDTSFIHRLDPVLARPFQDGFSHSMDTVFMIAAGVLLVGFAITCLLPELPLNNKSGLQARNAAEADAESTPPV